MPRSDDVLVSADAPAGGSVLRTRLPPVAARIARRAGPPRPCAAAASLRSRGSAFVAAAGLLFLGGGAFAATGGAPVGDPMTKDTIMAVQRALGIQADGVLGPATRRATKRFQRAHGLKPDGLLGPQTLAALGIDPDNPQVVSAAIDPRLEAIAECESGGDPTSVSAGGKYRGKYQFDRETWRSVGGKGDPAKAPESEQDMRAAKLLAREGTTPWPVCGKGL